MGGTFDPIHYGHLLMAEEARQAFSLDYVVFVPNGLPAHKKAYHVTDPEHRYNMTALAIESNPCFSISRIEIERSGPSYSIDTIRHFRQIYPDLDELYFITGADAIMQILTWHDYPNLVKQCKFIAVTRPGFMLDQLKHITDAEFLKKVSFLSIPLLEISSTDIRNRMAIGKSVKYLTPDSVIAYIKEESLFKNRM